MNIFQSIFKRLFSEDIASFESQIQSQNNELDKKNVTIREEIKKNNRLNTKINTLTEERSRLQIQINDLTGEKAELKAKITNLKREKIVFEERLNQLLNRLIVEKYVHKSKINKYNAIILSKEKDITDVLNKIKNLEGELSEKQNECERNIDTIEQCHRTIEDLESEKSVLKQQCENYKDSITSLSSQKSNLEQRIEELCRNLIDTRSIVEEKEKKNNELSDFLHKVDTELNKTKSSNETLNNEIKKITGLHSESQIIIDSLKSKNESLEKEIHTLQANLNLIKNQHVDEELVKALKNDISNKQVTIIDLESEIQKLNEELSSIHIEKKNIDNLFNEKNKDCEDLKSELRSLSIRIDEISNVEKELIRANNRISDLQTMLHNAPDPKELIKKEKEIERLNAKIKASEEDIKKLKDQINKSKETEDISQKREPRLSHFSDPVFPPNSLSTPITKPRIRYRKQRFPYTRKPLVPSADVITVNFPKIENYNIYAYTSRMIDTVFNHRSNSYITADRIFKDLTAEEISKIRFDLEDAIRKGEPYLTCPCCENMVKISSRRVGFGAKGREVQFFTHAEKNIVCDLKRDNYTKSNIDNEDSEQNDYTYLKKLRHQLANSLKTDLSIRKGLSEIEESIFIYSDELPIMKRRLADVSAKYNDWELVFQFVTPTTTITRVDDRDIFYLINKKQIFWIFGLESIVNYDELRRSVSKDIMFTNKRNVFVFDLEAQEESNRRGELMLKCNWLDESGEWYYKTEKNNINGILISIDQIHFEEDGCRPYYYNADEPYFLSHPTAERPQKRLRETLKKEIIESYEYDIQKKAAVNKMGNENRSVEAYFDEEKWGFKFEDVVFIEPQYDAEPLMQGDFAKVLKDGKCGVVDRFGNPILHAEYERIELIPNGNILYADNDEWHLRGVIEPVCDYANSDEVEILTLSSKSSVYHIIIKKNTFEGQKPEELYFVGSEIFKKNPISSKWSLWQSNGEKITDISWDSFEITSEDTIKVSVNGCIQLLAFDGTVIEEQKYKTENILTNGFILTESFEGYWGLMDNERNEIVHPTYDSIVTLKDKYLKIQKDNLWGIMSSEGEIIVEPIYHSVDAFDGENFVVTKPNDIRGWGYLSGKVDMNGDTVFEIITRTETGGIITKSFEKYGLEQDGIVLINHIYDSLFYWGEDKYVAEKDKKFGIVDTRNNILLDFEYSLITPLKEGKSSVKKGVALYVIDCNLKIVEDEIINLNEGYKKIKIKGKWGIKNPKGEIIVDFLYDEITTFRGRLIGVINKKLVKLNAYYPYRLPMIAINEGIFGNKDLVISGSVEFQNITRRIIFKKGQEITVVLINWTPLMSYPIVEIFDKDRHCKRSKHIDKPSDFTIGDEFEVKVKSIRKRSGKGRRKRVIIGMPNGGISYIYKNDFDNSGIDIERIYLGELLIVTKLGFDEVLDRTKWSVRKK